MSPLRIAREALSRATALALLGSPLLGCSDSAGNDPGRIDSLPSLTVTAETRIGSEDDPDRGFSWLAAIDVDTEDNVYALEGQALEIRVYSSSGEFLRRFGKRGGGPGEFESLPRFGVKGDTVWTFDSRAGRITLFNRQGTVLSTGRTRGLQITIPPGYGWTRGHIHPIRMRPDGLLTGWFTMVSSSSDDPQTDAEPTDSIPIPRIVFDVTGAVVDTIGWTPHPPPRMLRRRGERPRRLKQITVGSRQYTVPPPPFASDWLPLDDGHVVIAVPYAERVELGRFTVTRIALNGDTVYHRVFTYRPAPFTPAQLDSAAVWSARTGGPNSGPAPEDERRVVANALRAALDFPEFRLPIEYSWLANDQSVWLALQSDDTTVSRWMLIDPGGNTRGELTLPVRALPRWSVGDAAWIVDYDELDVPWLVRYRIARNHDRAERVHGF